MSQSASKSQRYIEVFSTNNQLLLNKWKTHSSVKKVYDEEIKTFVFTLKGKSPVPLMHWPKDKTNGNICHPIVVFQIYFTLGANILIDIGVKTSSNLRKRITLSSNQKKPRVTTLSVALPLMTTNGKNWTHLFMDLEDIISSTWKNEYFRNIDSLSLGGVCQLKRIFVLKREMIHNEDGTWLITYEKLPKQILLPQSIPQTYNFITCLDDGKSEDTKSFKSNQSGFSSTSTSYSSINSIRDRGKTTPSISKNVSQTRISNKATNRTNRGNEIISEEEDCGSVCGDGITPALSRLSLSNSFISSNSDYRFYPDRVTPPDASSPVCSQNTIFVPPVTEVDTENLKSRLEFEASSGCESNWNDQDELQRVSFSKSIQMITDQFNLDTHTSDQNKKTSLTTLQLSDCVTTEEVKSISRIQVSMLSDNRLSNSNEDLTY